MPRPPHIPYATPAKAPDGPPPPLAQLASVAAPPANPGPLTPEQLQALAAATTRMKKIRRAIKWANFDGWMLALFGGLTLLGSLGSIVGMLLGVALGMLAFVELHSAKQLKLLNPQAPRLLGLNQLGLAAVLILYAAYSLMFPAQLPAEVQASVGDIKSLGYDPEIIYGSFNTIIYGALIFIALITAAMQAPFYFRRQRMVKDYLAETPQWVLQMQRAGVSV